MHYNESGKGKRGKLSAEQKRSALWYKCTSKFGKVAKCAAGAKSLRTTALRVVFLNKARKKPFTETNVLVFRVFCAPLDWFRSNAIIQNDSISFFIVSACNNVFCLVAASLFTILINFNLIVSKNENK